MNTPHSLGLATDQVAASHASSDGQRLPWSPWKRGVREAAACATLLATSLYAATSAAQASQPAAEDVASCMEVVVDGQRVPPSFDCLTSRLSPKPQTTANQRPGGDTLAAEALTQRPSNQLGLFNRAATGHRMGNQFGISAFPQRPPEAPRTPQPIPSLPR